MVMAAVCVPVYEQGDPSEGKLAKDRPIKSLVFQRDGHQKGGMKAPYETVPSAFDTIDAERWAQNHCPPGGPAQSPRKRGQGFLQDH